MISIRPTLGAKSSKRNLKPESNEPSNLFTVFVVLPSTASAHRVVLSRNLESHRQL